MNTIRVYNVSPDINHDDCASIFNAAGIYMIMDVNSPFAGESIDRSNPSSSYHVGYLTRVFKVIENFKGYKNTLAFFAGNEVINDIATAKDNPQYIRAVQRDMKNYIAKHSSRTIPVGYSAADVREILHDTWAYLQCAIDGKTDASRSDFFGLNSYSWCGSTATFETSGYDDIVSMFSNSTVPVFFSEYGCNEVKPRVFTEVGTLYGEQMTVLSGGLVYEYSQEESDYGLVNINDNGTISLRTDFDNLQGEYNKLNITLIESANSTATSLTAPKCASSLISNSQFSTNFTLPAICPGCQDLIDNGVSGGQEGKLVSVTATALPFAVYGTNGQEITGLKLNILSDDDSNVPGGSSLNSSSTSSGATPSSTKKGAASVSFKISSGAIVAVALAFVVLL